MSDAAALPQDSGARLSNTPEYSVSELSGALKRTVEDRFGAVRVRGEVSNYRGPHSSGHAYFSLKDEGARLDAVMWRTAFARLKIKPEEGMDVIATGKITTFPGKSAYQIVIETIEPAGIGALMAMLDERRRRLAAEGLFDAARKLALPFLPHSVGVVTSPTGAVIRDVLHRIAARFPRRVVVWPVRVQGETSAAEVARAIRGFNELARSGAIAPPHVLIVARGGGSLEDLWGFNDEAVVRAAAESLIPLISAVGHETDWTLLDHVADVRAPTPTGAAEVCVPVRADLLVALDRLSARHGAGALRLIDRARDALFSSARALPSGVEILAGPHQRLDRAGSRLPAGSRLGVDRRRVALARMGGRLAAQSPQARLARATAKLDALSGRLDGARARAAERRAGRLEVAAARLGTAFAARLKLSDGDVRRSRAGVVALAQRLRRASATARRQRSARLSALGQMLGALGHRGVLARGYALVRDEVGLTVRRPDDVAAGATLSVEFAAGTLRAEVIEPGSAPGRQAIKPRSRAPKPAGASGVRQGSLF